MVGDSRKNRGSYSDRGGERLQKYLIVFGLFVVYHVRTA